VCDAPLVQEGECGQLYGMFVIGNDNAASNGQYVHVPDGSGNRNYPDEDQKAVYTFNVATAGDYEIHGWVMAPNFFSNSFFLKTDDQSPQVWTFAQSNDYVDDLVDTQYFSAGTHTITVYLHRDGARLDKLALVAAGGSQQQSSLMRNTPARANNIMAASSAPEVSRSYYYADGQRIAMRERSDDGDVLTYLLNDHLHSTSLATDASGATPHLAQIATPVVQYPQAIATPVSGWMLTRACTFTTADTTTRASGASPSPTPSSPTRATRRA